MSSLVETVTALDSETKASRETIFASGLNNVAVNWYNDGMVVSNRSHFAVVTETRYDALRRETARIDGRGNVSRTRYDALGRVAAVTNALGETIVYAYDMRGNRISERGANTNETVIGVAGTNVIERFYDAYGRNIQ